MNTVSSNHQRSVSIVVHHIIKRLKKSGLQGAQLESAIAAVTGAKSQGEDSAKIKLSNATKKKLLKLVQTVGTIVVTGKKKLRIYTWEGYKNSIAAGTKNMKKYPPKKKSAQSAYSTEVTPVDDRIASVIS